QAVGAGDADDELADGKLAELAAALPAEDVQLFYQMALLGKRDLPLAPDPRTGVEMTLLRMLAFRPAPPAGAASAGPRAPGRSQTASGPERGAPRGRPARAPASPGAAAAAPGAPVTPPAPAAAQPGEEETGRTDEVPVATPWQTPDWARLIPDLELTGAAKLLAANCAYVRRKGSVIHLQLDSRSESLLTRARQNELASALSKRFGERLAVEIEVGNPALETPMQERARLSDERLEAARESLEADPNVRALKDMFGAELNPDSIELVDRGQHSRRNG
ncbi:MAG TPA: DNA polymerase III subunit gamma/tau C-terminal domain-containing protein, partial [Woeseiaceae bacterium]